MKFINIRELSTGTSLLKPRPVCVRLSAPSGVFGGRAVIVRNPVRGNGAELRVGETPLAAGFVARLDAAEDPNGKRLLPETRLR